jgi:hypothetical protein
MFDHQFEASVDCYAVGANRIQPDEAAILVQYQNAAQAVLSPFFAMLHCDDFSIMHQGLAEVAVSFRAQGQFKPGWCELPLSVEEALEAELEAILSNLHG